MQAEDGAKLHRCFRFWFMKEDEDAIKSISLEIRDDVGYTEPEWIISESRVQEWRSGQVSIVADFNFTVICFFPHQKNFAIQNIYLVSDTIPCNKRTKECWVCCHRRL